MEDLLFIRQVFQNSGIGVNVNPPQFASGSRAFVYLCLGIFAVVAAVIVNLRRSTTGLALSAVRGTEPGSKTIGIGVLAMKVLVAGLAAFVAGIGGAVLGLALGVALPSNYGTLAGVFWLVVLVTLGIRSNMAALFAGLLFALLPGITLVYLPSGFGNLLPLVFGVGALRVARFPDGWLTAEARRLRSVLSRVPRVRRRLAR
jgi:branched-chain amino acid transport system permease protein